LYLYSTYFLSGQNNFKARIYEINAFWISVSCLVWFVLKKEKLSAWWDAFLVFEIKVYLRIWDLSFWQFLIWRQLSRSLRLLDWFFLSLLCLSVFPTCLFLREWTFKLFYYFTNLEDLPSFTLLYLLFCLTFERH
jgi:hypothetical protein